MRISLPSTARALAGLLVCLAAVAHADTLHYGGDTSYFMPGFSYTALNVINTSSDIRPYDSFAVPVGETWTITGLFAQIGNPDPGVSVPLATWDFRTGMSASSEGTGIATGTSTAANTTAVFLPGTPINGPTPGYLLTVTLPTPIVLAGGQTYWYSLTPKDPNSYNMFIGGSTGHNNAVGPQDNFALIDIRAVNGGSPAIQTWSVDPALGLLGTTTAAPAVPEPSTLLLLFTGAGGVLTRLRKR